VGEWVHRNTKLGLLHETLGLAYVEQKKKKKGSDNANSLGGVQ
jgi:hypothetical protein